MAEAASMNGAEWLARALAGTGMTHVFFVESVMRRTLLQLSDLGVKPGPALGDVLRHVYERQLDGSVAEFSAALALAREIARERQLY